MSLSATPISRANSRGVWKSVDSSSWTHLTQEEKKSNVATWVEWTDSAIYSKPHQTGGSSSGERTCATRTYSDSCKEVSSINSSSENLLSNFSSCCQEDDNNSVFLEESIPELPQKQNPHQLARNVALYSTGSTTSNNQFLLQSNSSNNGIHNNGSSRSISPYDNVSEHGEAQLRCSRFSPELAENHLSTVAAEFRSGRRVSRSFELGDRHDYDDEDGPPPALPPKKKKHSLSKRIYS